MRYSQQIIIEDLKKLIGKNVHFSNYGGRNIDIKHVFADIECDQTIYVADDNVALAINISALKYKIRQESK